MFRDNQIELKLLRTGSKPNLSWPVLLSIKCFQMIMVVGLVHIKLLNKHLDGQLRKGYAYSPETTNTSHDYTNKHI